MTAPANQARCGCQPKVTLVQGYALSVVNAGDAGVVEIAQHNAIGRELAYRCLMAGYGTTATAESA